MARKQSEPRSSNYMMMHSEPIRIGETWLEPEELCYPNGGMRRKAKCLLDDGTLVVVTCGIPDTYFSIPAFRVVKGKRVKGYVGSEDSGFYFRAYQQQ